MVELQAHDHPVLPDAGEPVGIAGLNVTQPAADEIGDVMHHRPGLRAGADLQRLQRRDAAKLGTAEAGDVREAVFGQPSGALLADQHSGDRVHPAGQALAGHEDVRLDAVLGDPPHLPGAHQPGLHLVGDVDAAVQLAEFLDGFQIARFRQREAVGRRDRLHDHSRRVARCQRLFHRGQVVERHMSELIRPVGQKDLGEPVVARGHGEAGMAVVSLRDRDDPPAPGGMPGGLQRDVNRLATAAAVDDLGEVGRCPADEFRGERGAGAGRKVVVADIEGSHAGGDRLDQLRVAVTQVEGPTIEVNIDQPGPRHVPDVVALPAVDNQVDAGIHPEAGLAGVPVLAGLLQDVGLGLDGEHVVVAHCPCLYSSAFIAVSQGLAGHPRQAVMPVRLSRPANLRRMAGPMAMQRSRPRCSGIAPSRATICESKSVSVGPNSQDVPYMRPRPTRTSQVLYWYAIAVWAGVPGGMWRASG